MLQLALKLEFRSHLNVRKCSSVSNSSSHLSGRILSLPKRLSASNVLAVSSASAMIWGAEESSSAMARPNQGK